jgi:2-dehydropantoate 2-reductase
MRFVVVGAGAIGGVLGGRLHQSGFEVLLVARGPHLDAIQRDGLTLEDPDRTATLAVPAVGTVAEAELDPDDVLLLCVKGQQTAAVLDDLVAAAPPPSLPVVCAQNGLENERVVLRSFERTYGVNVQCPAAHMEPGVVQATSTPITGLLDVGRHPDGVDEVADQVAASFAASTFLSVARPDIVRWKRRKLLSNLRNVIDAALERSRASELLSARAVAEGEAVFAAARLDVASAEEDEERRADHLQVKPIRGEPRGGGSTWQSLARGTGNTEADLLNGEIVLLGRLHRVPTPTNALLQHLAHQATNEGWAPRSRPAEPLLAALPPEAGEWRRGWRAAAVDRARHRSR